MTESFDTDDQNLALASLLLDNPDPPLGDKPTIVELWDWMHGSLSPQRASEVETHVARDPNIFEQWRQLRLSESQVEQYVAVADSKELDESTTGWWQKIRGTIANLSMQPIRGIAVGLTMVMVFVTAGLLRQAPETGLNGDIDFWTEWQSPKQNSATNPDEDQQAHLQVMLSGVSVHLQTEPQPSAGPDGELLPDTDCRGTAACGEESRLLFSLGRRAAAARSFCIGGRA